MDPLPRNLLFRNSVSLQKFADRRIDPDELVAFEGAVIAAGYRQQLIRDFDVVERLVQANGVVVRRNPIGITVNGQNRW